MTSDLEIRTFRAEDLDQVVAIEKATFPDPYGKLLFRWFGVVTGNGFIVARRERVLGYLISEIRGGQGHIVSMAVDPECRRTGIGEALLREGLARMASKVHEVYLEVRAGNEAAIRLYEKHSFKMTGDVLERYYPDGESAIVMSRVM
jgi:[ribosomal protein S18]-alanine N-acetyltransferase